MKKIMQVCLALVAGFVIISIATQVVLRVIQSAPRQAASPDYWPNEGWRANTPEEQGLDSIKLAEGLRSIQSAGFPVHSLMIVRNEYVVLDAVYYPYDGQLPHNLGSVTKSVLTTLIGIAADQGKLRLDDPLLSFFPTNSIANPDTRKDHITVKDLLSMTSGLDCIGLPSETTMQEMEASPDWVQFMLDRPMASEPGSTFVYCGGSMHLLSAILQKATGMTVLEYACQYLFEPLGIQQVVWPTDPQGVNQGSGNLRLLPADMARLGFLFLHDGIWNNQQVVSKEWVRNAVRSHNEAGTYGYGWWVSTGKTGSEFNADGSGGQHIAVVPGLNLILVTTGGGFNVDDVVPFLFPALVDMEKPLPCNPAGVEDLNRTIKGLTEAPLPQPPKAYPEMAIQISGQTILFENNLLQLRSLYFEFNDQSEAEIQFTFSDGSQSPLAAIGLDGVYRMTTGVGLDRALRTEVETVGKRIGMRGTWTDEGTFVIEYDTITNRYAYQLELRLAANGVTLVASDRLYGTRVTILGKLENH